MKTESQSQLDRFPRTALYWVGGILAFGLVVWVCGVLDAWWVDRLPISSPADLLAADPGSRVLIEGRIGEDNPVALPETGFVAYHHLERDINVDDEGWPHPGSWRVTRRVTPPLLIETTGGPVQVENEDYRLDLIPHTVTGPRTTSPGPGARHLRDIGYSTTREEGFLAGDPVIVVGRVRSGREIPHLDAEFVAGGTREGYIATKRSNGPLFLLFGSVPALLGSAVLSWGWWFPRLMRLLRPQG